MSAATWTKTPPTEQGTYWHWNGDQDSAPVPIFVLYSGFTGKCFVTMGQLGMDHATDCDEYGGWWMPLPDPKTPDQLELDAIRSTPFLAPAPVELASLEKAARFIVHDIETLTRCWIETNEEEKAVEIVKASIQRHFQSLYLSSRLL